MMRRILPLLAAAAICLPAASVAYAEPSLHQVYETTRSGNLHGAENMMTEVLRNHPQSAKAHFVEAEILAREGRNGEASNELVAARKLDPSLSFAQPQAVQALDARLSGARPSAVAAYAAAGNFPMGWLVFAGGLIAFIVLAARWMQARATPSVRGVRQGGAPYGGGYAAGMGGGYGPMAPSSGGVGSGILGGLATGAAVGAGMVAGEALMHRVIDGPRSGVGGEMLAAPDPYGSSDQYDMGGQDFGVSDASSWDDNSSSSDDWS